MRTWIGRARWLALGLMVPLALTGCFRSAGEDLPPTQPGGVVMVSNQNTQEPPMNTPELIQPTVEPTDIMAPTAEEATEFPTPIPTLSPFPTMPFETETPQATFEGQGGPLGPTATRTVQAVVIAPTFTPQPTSVVVIIQPTSTPQPTFTTQPTYTPLPTYTPPPTYTPLPTVIAQVPTIVPLATNTTQPVYTRAAPQTSGIGPTMTFTPVPFMRLQPSPTYTPYAVAAAVQPIQQAGQPIIPTQPQEAIPMAEQPTFTPMPGGQGGPLTVETPPAVAQVATLTPYYVQPTFTPAIPQGPTLNANQMTATQMIYGATATMAYLMGTQLPPATPYGGQVVQPQVIIQPGQYPPNATLITATPYGQVGMCAEHRISIGETLYRIAARYGVTAQAIATANNIVNPDLIEAGKTLQIPCPSTPTATPVGAVQPSTGVTTTTTTGQQIYVVQAGDNIYRISLKFGVEMGELVAINGLNEITMNSIYVGQELIIPATATTIIATPIPGVAPTLTPYNIVVTPIPGTTG